VVADKVFKGKYVIKLIVRQGDPSRTYHFAQKVELEVRGKTEELDIFYAFTRSQEGEINQLKG
jgi:hypothetical protein